MKSGGSRSNDMRLSHRVANRHMRVREGSEWAFKRMKRTIGRAVMNMKMVLLSSVAAFALGGMMGPALADGMDDLVAAAKKEGQLTVIALPHDWCGYGALILSLIHI